MTILTDFTGMISEANAWSRRADSLPKWRPLARWVCRRMCSRLVRRATESLRLT